MLFFRIFPIPNRPARIEQYCGKYTTKNAAPQGKSPVITLSFAASSSCVRVLWGSNPPLQSIIQHFAEQRNVKSTPAFSGCFGCRKRKNGLRDSCDGHPEARFASFYAIFAVKCRKKQEKTPFALVDKRRFFYGCGGGI